MGRDLRRRRRRHRDNRSTHPPRRDPRLKATATACGARTSTPAPPQDLRQRLSDLRRKDVADARKPRSPAPRCPLFDRRRQWCSVLPARTSNAPLALRGSAVAVMAVSIPSRPRSTSFDVLPSLIEAAGSSGPVRQPLATPPSCWWAVRTAIREGATGAHEAPFG